MKAGLRAAIEQMVPLAEAEWTTCADYWHEQHYAKDAFITAQGEVEEHLYFVLEGIQRLYLPTANGQEHLMGFSFDGSFSGVYDSFTAQTPSDYVLQALTPSRILAISYADLNLLFDQFKTFERWGRLFAQAILFGRVKRESELLSLSAAERFESFQRRSPRILDQIPQRYLASYLNMTPETFSRLRKKFASTS